MSSSRGLSWPVLNKVPGKSVAINNVISSMKNENVATHKSSSKNFESGICGKNKVPNNNNYPQGKKLVYSHYYPEGGWGWVIVLVGILAHLLSSGLQLSLAGTLALPAEAKFHRQPLDTSGTFIVHHYTIYYCFFFFII